MTDTAYHAPPAAPTLGKAAELRRLELLVTRKLDGLLQGDHRGLVPGHGSELGETREYQRAEDCAHKAAAQTDPKLKADFLDLKLRRLFLAQGYEFTKRLADFSDEAKRRADARPAKN